MKVQRFSTVAVGAAVAILGACQPPPEVVALEPEPAERSPRKAGPAPESEPEPGRKMSPDEAAALARMLTGQPNPNAPEAPASEGPSRGEPPKTSPPSRTTRRSRAEPAPDRNDREPQPAVRRPTPLPARRPAADGGLSDHQFESALSGWRGVHACLRTQTRRNQQRRGAMKVAFTIASSGDVQKAEVRSGPRDPGLRRCVERRARRVQFPAFERPASVQRSAKFVF